MDEREQLELTIQKIGETQEGLAMTRSHKRRQDLRRALEKLNRRKRQLERELTAEK